MGFAPVYEPELHEQKRNGDDADFNEEALGWAYGNGLAQETIEAKGCGQHEAKPGEHACGKGLDEDGDHREYKGYHLQAVKAFAQETDSPSPHSEAG